MTHSWDFFHSPKWVTDFPADFFKQIIWKVVTIKKPPTDKMLSRSHPAFKKFIVFHLEMVDFFWQNGRSDRYGWTAELRSRRGDWLIGFGHWDSLKKAKLW